MPNGQAPHGEGDEPDSSRSSRFHEIESEAFYRAMGESHEDFFDLNKWQEGELSTSAYERVDRECQEAVRQESLIRKQVRNELFPKAFCREGHPRDAGCYKVTGKQLEQVYKGLLFNGSVEACDGISNAHPSLAMTIAQIGVSLIAYNGNQGAWLQRLYRRDLRMQGPDPLQEVIKVLDQRQRRSKSAASDIRDMLSDLGRRGLLYFGERATLLERSQALWRMGHGVPIPYELLTGSGLIINGDMPLLRHSIRVLHKLLGDHQQWVFVSKKFTDLVLLTFGDALLPGEYAIIDSYYPTLLDIVQGNRPSRIQDEALQFVEDIGKKIVVGVYRASRTVPACVFYAHENFVHQAALIAMADSVLQEHRGFPMLLDIAQMVCKVTFGAEVFNAMVQQAYLEAGLPYRALDEWDK